MPLANLDLRVIHQDGQLWAIITNNNTGEVFTVKVGEYLGENYGRVQKSQTMQFKLMKGCKMPKATGVKN